MRNAVFASTGLHLVVLALMVAGLPQLFEPDPVQEVAVAVEVVTPADRAKPKPKKQEPKAKPPPPKPKEAKPPPPPPPTPQQTALAKPPPEPEEKPEIVPVEKAEPKPKPPKPKVQPAPKQIAKAVPPPRKRPKPKQKPKPDPFKALLKNLAEEANKPRPKDPEPEPERRVELADVTPQPKISDLERRQIMAGLAELVKQQITPCWNIPVGAKDAHRMRIGIRIFLNPDGSLRGVPRIEDSARVSRDPFYRALAESAVRALRNPRCSPLKLPHDKYDIWQEISFNFDPREALEP